MSLVALAACAVQADITTDGRLGPATRLSGPDMRIGAELGQTRGGNLFHSFESFNISRGQSATFTGPDTIQNVISRVTGGQESKIDGTLRSKVGMADVYLINPAGVVIGEDASIDVPASLHISTANELRFSDGGRFSATDPNASSLTLAAPESFGFLAPQPAQLTINGAQLDVAAGETLSLSAGTLEIGSGDQSGRAPSLSAPDGSLVLTAVSEGTAAIHPSAYQPAPAAGGSIDIQGGALLNVSGTSGRGQIELRGGPIRIDNSTLAADHGGPTAATGGILLQGTQVELRHSQVQALAVGSGAGPSISITADQLDLGADASGEGTSLIATASLGAGEAGDIVLELARGLTVASGSAVNAGSQSSGAGGDIAIRSGGDILVHGGYLDVSAGDRGAAGSIRVQADGAVNLLSGGTMMAATFGTEATSGGGGTIFVQAPLIHMQGQDASEISSGINARTVGGGDAGQIVLDTEHLVTRDAMLSSRTDGSGQGGSIDISAAAGTLMVNSGLDVSSGGGNTDERLGDAGRISVNTGELDIRHSTLSALSANRANAGTIDIHAKGNIRLDAAAGSAGLWATNIHPTETFGFDPALAATEARGGDIRISAQNLLLLNGATILNLTTAGDAGEVRVAADSLGLLSGSAIMTGTAGPGDAGSVRIELNQTLWMLDAWIDAGTTDLEISDLDSLITGSAPSGAGGPIDIQAGQAILQSGSAIQSISFSDGPAGDIKLNVGRLELSKGGLITTYAGGTGNGGDLRVTASQSIRIRGVDPQASSPILGKSGLFTTSAFLEGSGGAGAIVISTPSLELAAGGAIESRTGGQPPGGPIRIEAGRALIRQGGKIDASTFGDGQGGSISLTAGSLRIDGSGYAERDSLMRDTGIFSQALAGRGNAGDIDIAVAGDLSLHDSARISALSFTPGDAGAIQVSAGSLLIDGAHRVDAITGIESRATSYSSGFAGSIDLSAGHIGLSGLGSITIASLANVPLRRLDVLPDSGIRIEAGTMAMDDSLVSGISTGNAPASPIGILAEQLSLSNGSAIETRSLAADGGPIAIHGGWLWLDHSTITTSAEGPVGDGGNITLSPRQLILDGGFIQANTAAAGARGGDILIDSEVLIASHDLVEIGGTARVEYAPGSDRNVIQAAAPLGVQGTIALTTPDLEIAASLVPLRAPFQDANAILSDLCQLTDTREASALIELGSGGLPPDAAEPMSTTLGSERLKRLLSLD
ncbi:hypothetical protein Thiowin_02969 [Thiorhodovibrio winogradskyi]|uniref:Filamentous haemagglutinin FhaB/tRNA nuclease CdiA-like TPS domain-containing protein n=2 Tax=Thiorhodovibrio winogradskyi TaxID=77007 RepID=A0ABZ0SCU5_9GAMM